MLNFGELWEKVTKMNTMNRIGKFETLTIVNAVDRALIDRFGINMTDAKVDRYEVLSAYAETGNANEAADFIGLQRGLSRLPESKIAA